MTFEQFLSKLESYNFVWYRPFGDIRTVIEKGEWKNYCPITAVCYKEGRGDFNVSEYSAASDMLDLDRVTRLQIIDAADLDALNHNNRLALEKACKLL